MPFHDGHFGHFEHFGHYGLTQYGPEYGHHWCLWKDQEKCRSPMKTELKKLQRFKSYGQKKFTLKLGPFSFVFWPEISTSLRDPLGCSDLSQIFFGSSLIATEWDKIVAEIIHKTFLFLRHPTHGGSSQSVA